MMKKNGFSMVEVMIVCGLLGGLALVLMHFSRTIANNENRIYVYQDLNEFNTALSFYFRNMNECKTSLEGATFHGATIKNTPVPFEIWNADQNGVRTTKKFSATEASHKKFGKLDIEDISFTMPDYTGADFPEGLFQTSAALIKVDVMARSINLKKSFNFPLYLLFSTDSSGLSTVLACGQSVPGSGKLVQSPLSGQYVGTGIYTYSGTRTPQFLIAEITGYGGSNREGGTKIRWLTESHLVIKDWTRIRATNIGNGNDGGSGMTDSDLATIPFLGAKKIEFAPSGSWPPTINLIGIIESD